MSVVYTICVLQFSHYNFWIFSLIIARQLTRECLAKKQMLQVVIICYSYEVAVQSFVSPVFARCDDFIKGSRSAESVLISPQFTTIKIILHSAILVLPTSIYLAQNSHANTIPLHTGAFRLLDFANKHYSPSRTIC